MPSATFTQDVTANKISQIFAFQPDAYILSKARCDPGGGIQNMARDGTSGQSRRERDKDHGSYFQEEFGGKRVRTAYLTSEASGFQSGQCVRLLPIDRTRQSILGFQSQSAQ